MCEITSNDVKALYKKKKESIALTSVNTALEFLQKGTKTAMGVGFKSTMEGRGKRIQSRSFQQNCGSPQLNATLSQVSVGKYLTTSSLEGKKTSSVIAFTSFHGVNAASYRQHQDIDMTSAD